MELKLYFQILQPGVRGGGLCGLLKVLAAHAVALTTDDKLL